VVGEDAVISTIEDYHTYLAGCNPAPEDDTCREHKTINVIDDVIQEFKGNETPYDESKVVKVEGPLFPEEYAVSGWFRWAVPVDQSIWHTAFRLTTNDHWVNENAQLLGDRDLGLWIGNEKTNNIMAFATYTYTDIAGNGYPNHW
jgi:hypothetical protein